MWKTFVCIALLLCCGCINRTKPELYGNFALAESTALVHDAMILIQSAYPPAKTRFVLMQTADDAFGVALLKTLRASGYAVDEYTPPAKGDKYMPVDEPPRVFAFAYVLDYSEPGELQLVLNIGDEIYSRTYAVTGEGRDASYAPGAYWTRKQLFD